MGSIIYNVALATTIGNMLQGWHGGAIAGALLYLKKEFNLEEKTEGSIVSIAIVGAFISTLCAGPLADWIGRRTVLSISAVLYSIGAIVMAWSPVIPVLITGRFLTGAAIGLASAISPLHISESSPAEIRGTLLTFPQMFGAIGMSLAYSLAFGLSLVAHPSWRMMLAVTIVPSLLYVLLCIFYVPESPRWLVSKGRMLEAKQVLQRLRQTDDVQAELALLVEGLGSGVEKLEEYILQPADSTCTDTLNHDGHVKIITPEEQEGLTWIATPITNKDNEIKSLFPLTGSLKQDGQPTGSSRFIAPDPVVSFINNITAVGSSGHLHSFKGSMSLLENIDVENAPGLSPLSKKNYETEEQGWETASDGPRTPLLVSHNRKFDEQEEIAPVSPFSNGLNGSMLSRGLSQKDVESVDTLTNHVGGGWQLAWQWSNDNNQFKRLFLHQEGVLGSTHASGRSMPSMPKLVGSGQDIVMQASALVGTPAQSTRGLPSVGSVGPAMMHPSSTALRGPAWSELLEPGVRWGLFVGCMLQFLQQFSGLNAVLYYTPQILQASTEGGFLSTLSKDSTSLLASAITGLLMIPFILWAVKLMDVAGRRKILLCTLPILFTCLVTEILISLFVPEGYPKAILSFFIMAGFICCFVMGFGPIPNILCAEIFPTRVRGLCSGLCSATMWLSTIFITYGFPSTVSSISLNGVFAIFAGVSLISCFFVYVRVPETKGMPLEVISDLFANFGKLNKNDQMLVE